MTDFVECVIGFSWVYIWINIRLCVLRLIERESRDFEDKGKRPIFYFCCFAVTDSSIFFFCRSLVCHPFPVERFLLLFCCFISLGSDKICCPFFSRKPRSYIPLLLQIYPNILSDSQTPKHKISGKDILFHFFPSQFPPCFSKYSISCFSSSIPSKIPTSKKTKISSFLIKERPQVLFTSLLNPKSSNQG